MLLRMENKTKTKKKKKKKLQELLGSKARFTWQEKELPSDMSTPRRYLS